MRPSIAAGLHRVLTIEVWHQTSGCKGTNFLREVQVDFHLASADKAGKALAAASLGSSEVGHSQPADGAYLTQSRWDYVNVRGFGAPTLAPAQRLPGDILSPWGAGGA